MAKAKRTQRREFLQKLAALSPADRAAFSRRAIDRLLAAPFYKNAAVVAAYASFGNEFPTAELLATVLRDGKQLGLPRIDPRDSSMTIHAVRDLNADLELHALGFREPNRNQAIISVEQIDLLIVPGIGFDLKGNRLGRGAGYYDRFLAKPELRAYPCALTFECQIADAILISAYDKPVSCIVTENRTIQVVERKT